MISLEIRAITISQPWASLIASGDKWIENRTWPTNHRGKIAIHAGVGTQYLSKHELTKYPTGCVIAIANLIACERLSFIQDMARSPVDQNDPIELHAKMDKHKPGFPKSLYRTWLQAADHQYAEGPYCWILDDVQPVKHYPCRGFQGLWSISSFLLELV